jgi:hypothetical protein
MARRQSLPSAKQILRRSPTAKALALPIYRQRIVKSKKIYSRKGRRIKHV